MKQTPLLLALLAVTLSGCGPTLAPRPEDRPATLIFSVEALSWDRLLPAMQAGRTPNLLDLARRGSAARLSSMSQATRADLWTSINTGKRAATNASAQPFWKIFEDAGHSVSIVGWPGDQDHQATEGRSSQDAALAVIEQRHPGVMAVHLPSMGKDETLPSSMQEMDAVFGRLRALMPPDTDIMVVSGHGAPADAGDGIWIAAGPSFRAPKPPFHVPDSASLLPRLGDEKGPGVLNILPTLLHIRGMAVAEDMEGEVMSSVLIGGTGGHPVQSIATYQ